MWKPLTGEPYAGKPHVRFGGRGGAEPSLPLSGGACAPGYAAMVLRIGFGVAGGCLLVMLMATLREFFIVSKLL